MRLCVNGVWRDVVVDDYFPCSFNGRYVYTHTRVCLSHHRHASHCTSSSREYMQPITHAVQRDELWAMLIEKAFAKVTGSFDALRAGLAHEALIELTGNSISITHEHYSSIPREHARIVHGGADAFRRADAAFRPERRGGQG